MDRIERDPAATPLLTRLRAELRATGRSPAAEVRQLARLVDFLSSGHNQIFGPIAALLLLGTQLAFAVERWRVRCGPIVPRWLAAVAEYEALSALATYHAEHPDDPFPEVVEGEPFYEGDALAHPLVPVATAVANDLAMGSDHPHLLIVSGSNMSGKSTLLRTVGVNAVLAQAGAPVRARRLRMSPLHVGATLRLNDSLMEGRSRFYAEITRIAAIVQLAKSPNLQISKSWRALLVR
jgi:DNA mismatch repair ATPase MutS